MDQYSKEDIVKALESGGKEEIIKILRRNNVKDDINTLEDIERIFFPKKEDVEQEASSFVCRKCKSNMVIFVQKQIRSTDEGVTTIFTCTSCKNVWSD
jgi:DNA-directed RNA polymerase subunit M/transcription elongation factor TFIIS